MGDAAPAEGEGFFLGLGDDEEEGAGGWPPEADPLAGGAVLQEEAAKQPRVKLLLHLVDGLRIAVARWGRR